jgi:phosphoglucomutase
VKSKDFLEKGYIDEDEDELSQENFLMLELENGFSVAIRPSGTEPKIKYYLFGCGEKNPSNLEESKKEVSAKIQEISKWLVQDANVRVEKKLEKSKPA